MDEILILSVDAIIVGGLAYFYKQASKHLNNVQNATVVNLNDPKAKNSITKVIDYACISGAIEPNDESINSSYKSDYKGIMRIFKVVQHGRRWVEKDQKSVAYSKTIVDETIEKPFHLKTDKTKVKIDIVNHQNAGRLKTNLETTHYKYDRSNESWIEAAATFLASNEITTGVEMTEKMLKNGTVMFAFGRLEKLADNSFVITRPFNEDCPFIITKENRLTLIDNMASELSLFKVGVIIIGGIGAIVGIITLINLYNKLTEKSDKGDKKEAKKPNEEDIKKDI